MSLDHNPYAPPKASLEAPPDEGLELWRAGKLLVCRHDAAFPDRCVKCNAPAEPPPVRYKLTWHSQWWYLLILVYVLIYFVVALIVRKRAELHVGLCAKHQRRRVLSRWVGWGGLAAIIASIWLGIAYDIGFLGAGGMLAILPWAFIAIILSPQLRAARIDKEYVRVRGCGKEFLASLQEFIE